MKIYKGQRIKVPMFDTAGNVTGEVSLPGWVDVLVLDDGDKSPRELRVIDRGDKKCAQGLDWQGEEWNRMLLGLSICVDALGAKRGFDAKVYVAFMRDYVDMWGDAWHISDAEIEVWYRKEFGE